MYTIMYIDSGNKFCLLTNKIWHVRKILIQVILFIALVMITIGLGNYFKIVVSLVSTDSMIHRFGISSLI